MATTETGERGLPPGPSEPFPIDADVASFQRMQECFEEYGDIYRIQSPGRDVPTYVLNHPDMVQRVLVTNWRNYVKGRGFERVKMLLGNGLIVSDGEHWLEQRKMIQPAFKRDVIGELSEVTRRVNRKLLSRWDQLAEEGTPVDVNQETSELALDIILGTIFGEDLENYRGEDGKTPFAVLVDHNERDLALVVKFRALTKIVAAIMETRREANAHPVDFLSMLMNARRKATGAPMTDKDLIDEIMTLIVAGHETTAATLSWLWYSVAEHPEVEERLHAEVDPLMGDEPPAFADLDRYPFTKKLMFETLRHFPPVWLFTRKALGPDRLGEYDVAPGTDIFLSPYIVHRHPGFWDEPRAFRPERFGVEGVNTRHEFAYFPFSMGPRRCTGDFFALVETVVHVGWIAPRFRLRYVPDRPLELDPAVNLRSKHGIRMRIERR